MVSLFSTKKSVACTIFIIGSMLCDPSHASSRRVPLFNQRNNVKHEGLSNLKKSYKTGNSLRNRNTRNLFQRSHADNNPEKSYDNIQTSQLHSKSKPYYQTHSNDYESEELKNQPLDTQQNVKLLRLPLSLVLQDSSSSQETPIQTYLDTGAQVTVMTFQAAKKAGIAHLIDKRYAGRACGVAGVSCRVLGRIPANSVSFLIDVDEDTHILDKSPSITILEDSILEGGNHNGVDMLLGLDILEEWEATLCLKKRTLIVRNAQSEKTNYMSSSHVSIPLLDGKPLRSQRAFVPNNQYSTSEKMTRDNYSLATPAGWNLPSNKAVDNFSQYDNEEDDEEVHLKNHEHNYFDVDDNNDEDYFIDSEEEDYDGCDLSGV